MTNASKSDVASIKSLLPVFLAQASAAKDANALMSKSEGIGAAVSKLVTDLTAQIDYNVELGNDLRKINQRSFDTALWSMILGVGAVLLGIGTLA